MPSNLVATALNIVVMLGFLLTVVPIMVWVERRGSALIQDRPGPNRLGPFGLIQPLADALKFMFKEDVTPTAADKPLYLLAPALAIMPAMLTISVIPFGPDLKVGDDTYPLMIADAPAGVLLFLALASLAVYSLVLAGYASNNKFSLMGAIRASAQMISYELALTLAVLAVVIPVGSFHLGDIVQYQRHNIWNFIPQILGFGVFLIASFAETNRLPFDLPEAESELVAGFHTEYSAMRFASFFMGEYMSMTSLSALGVTLYFGGWSLPGVDLHGWLGAIVGLLVLVAKIAFCMSVFVWVRWSFPRFRYDQLMRLGWKVLLPIAIFNLILVSVMTLSGILGAP
ncbi:MAG TPA: NADH-quinone oxidoreductase subunit NuoH [Thermoanaerobaculia bacterium]|jgi:NADH-quinone oxidoreductase subunit H|nr:NADH-quinone oxidoreductase subunit NuoH [Thermoanaerobaculia bacterium]